MLTLQFLRYTDIEKLDSEQRVLKLIDLVKKEKIILLEGRLKPEEEAKLIQKALETIDEKFKGIELGVIHPEEDKSFSKKIKSILVNVLIGSDRTGMTIIGPASIVSEIKKDPEKIELLTKGENHATSMR